MAKPLQILLAEDNQALRKLTKALLVQKGHEVVAVGDGLEALRACSERQFDVLVIDDEMPGASGTEVTRTIRLQEKSTGKHQIILSLTGNSLAEDQQRLLDAGFDACLTKPFHMEDLYRAIEIRPCVIAPDMLPDSADPVDRELLERVGGDAKLLRRMIVAFLKDCPKKMLRVKEAILQKDTSELASAAHALKGAVGMFGEQNTMQHAQLLVDMGKKGTLDTAEETFRVVQEEVANLERKLRGYVAQAKRNPSNTRKKGSGL